MIHGKIKKCVTVQAARIQKSGVRSQNKSNCSISCGNFRRLKYSDSKNTDTEKEPQRV